MAKKKQRDTFGRRLGQTVADMADAVSVAATGSQIGVLEMAAEEELNPSPVKRARKAKAAPKKKVVAKKASKPAKKKRTSKRR